jgi:hypothetical protein
MVRCLLLASAIAGNSFTCKEVLTEDGAMQLSGRPIPISQNAAYRYRPIEAGWEGYVVGPNVQILRAGPGFQTSPPEGTQGSQRTVLPTVYQANQIDDRESVPIPQLQQERSVLQVQNLAIPQNPGFVSPGPATFAPPNAPVMPSQSPQPSGGLNWGTTPPQNLDSGFATVGNCPCVTAPVQYASNWEPCGCGPITQTSSIQPNQIAPPIPYAAPVAAPPQYIAPIAAPTGFADVGCRPLISFGQERYPIVNGYGIIGQPKAYVPGQWFRNFIRYLSP